MEYTSPKKSRSASISSPKESQSLIEALPDEMLAEVMKYLDLKTKTRTRRASRRFKEFIPSRVELNNIRQQLRIIGLLLLTGHYYYDLVVNDQQLTIQAKDKNHTSTILIKKSKPGKYGKIIYETPNQPDYEQQIDQSLLYGSQKLDISHFLNLISTLVDLYPNGTITINRNKIDLSQDLVQLGSLLAQQRFDELNLRDDLVDNFFYNHYVFKQYERFKKKIPNDVIPILEEIL